MIDVRGWWWWWWIQRPARLYARQHGCWGCKLARQLHRGRPRERLPAPPASFWKDAGSHEAATGGSRELPSCANPLSSTPVSTPVRDSVRQTVAMAWTSGLVEAQSGGWRHVISMLGVPGAGTCTCTPTADRSRTGFKVRNGDRKRRFGKSRGSGRCLSRARQRSARERERERPICAGIAQLSRSSLVLATASGGIPFRFLFTAREPSGDRPMIRRSCCQRRGSCARPSASRWPMRAEQRGRPSCNPAREALPKPNLTRGSWAKSVRQRVSCCDDPLSSLGSFPAPHVEEIGTRSMEALLVVSSSAVAPRATALLPSELAGPRCSNRPVAGQAD